MQDMIAGRYEVVAKIGACGMGNVFRATDHQTGNAVAIKQLKATIAIEETVFRFMREGEALRQLNHPNIVSLLDMVQVAGDHYLIMELVEGGTLDDLLHKVARLPVD